MDELEKKHLQALHEHSLIGNIVIAMSGEIIYCNKKLAEIIDSEKNEIEGKNFFQEIPKLIKAKSNEEINAEYLNKIFSSLIDGHPLENETKILINGKEVFVNYHLHAFSFNENDPEYYISISVENTSEKRRIDEAKKVSEMITDHDIKTQLQIVIGFSELIEEEEADDSDSKKFAATINKAGRNIKTIIDNKTLVEKIRMGQYRPEKTGCNLLDFFKKEILSSVRHQGIDAKISYPGNPLHLMDVKIDQRVIKYLLINLVRNAFEACEMAGQKNIFVSMEANERGLFIIIKNPGTIPSEIRGRFMEEGVTFGKKDGTGLGVFSAKLIAEANGGTISYETSDEANTTTITVVLPV
ncbi:MAG: PAS domain-containing sensor histidine kinase [Patescibacteria group bacterium]|jgi:PAS domain S-box-containing protein